jgi:hypothetical protein
MINYKLYRASSLDGFRFSGDNGPAPEPTALHPAPREALALRAKHAGKTSKAFRIILRHDY